MSTMERVEGTKLRYRNWMRDWKGPILHFIFVAKFDRTTQQIECLPSSDCVDAFFMAIGMVLLRAEAGGYTRQRESDAARLAREEEAWLCGIVDQFL